MAERHPEPVLTNASVNVVLSILKLAYTFLYCWLLLCIPASFCGAGSGVYMALLDLKRPHPLKTLLFTECPFIQASGQSDELAKPDLCIVTQTFMLLEKSDSIRGEFTARG